MTCQKCIFATENHLPVILIPADCTQNGLRESDESISCKQARWKKSTFTPRTGRFSCSPWEQRAMKRHRSLGCLTKFQSASTLRRGRKVLKRTIMGKRDTVALWAFVIPMLCMCTEVHMQGTSPNSRQNRLFNVVQIVTFPNDPCSGSGTSNGTCYTSEECLSRGGTNVGSCAAGFGVCCVFTVGCGSTSSENCTYFIVTGATAGQCTTTICPCGNNICQLRLDFETFIISGPATVTTSAFATINGQPSTAASALGSGLSSNCLTDTFAVTNPVGTAPPTICGTNTGEHMYVDSSSTCNDLTFQVGTATTVTRNWNIKITQYSCNYNNLAPDGCTQYFFGSTTGLVTTYNYQSGNGRHLANQNQAQCVRRERGNCRICWSRTAAADVVLSGTTGANRNNNPSTCCGYGTNGKNSGGYDCYIIPGAMNTLGAPNKSRQCGDSGTNTFCSVKAPFLARFMSDGFEFAGATIKEANNNNIGYRLGYFMDSINC